ncbi:MAG: hypothetical protein VX252_11535 [Myxococcota bacterium]|nr:hypothetical protein [Myxococcota bacterium]
MQTFIATALLIGLLMAGMALGLMLRGRSLSGSCGGTGEGCACSEAKRKRCLEENA